MGSCFCFFGGDLGQAGWKILLGSICSAEGEQIDLLLGLHQNCYHQENHFQIHCGMKKESLISEGFVFEKCGCFLFMWLDKLVVLPWCFNTLQQILHRDEMLSSFVKYSFIVQFLFMIFGIYIKTFYT